MLTKNYTKLSEIRLLFREEYSERKRLEYSAKKKAKEVKRLIKQGDCNYGI